MKVHVRNVLILLFSAGTLFTIAAQSLYFPPLTGTAWDTISPSRLGWQQERIDSLYSFLESKNTTGFIILKDGKIVLEKYFGTFTADSFHNWASSSKSLTAMLTGIAQENGLLNINDTVSDHLGEGWTAETADQERLITIRHLLTMTSGISDRPTLPCTSLDSGKACLQYLGDAGTVWAYQTGAYEKIQQVISNASGKSYNAYTNSTLGSRIGMTGVWGGGGQYSSTTRGMARFGLLALNRGLWASDTLLHDTAYFRAMTSPSQTLNPAYGYLWWLNGQDSYLVPGSQIRYQGSLISTAPSEMIAALGAHDQKIYIIPSTKMVIVRNGESAYGATFASSPFDSVLWNYLDSLDVGNGTGLSGTRSQNAPSFFCHASCNGKTFMVNLNRAPINIGLYDITGRRLFSQNGVSQNTIIPCAGFAAGLYVVRILADDRTVHAVPVMLTR